MRITTRDILDYDDSLTLLDARIILESITNEKSELIADATNEYLSILNEGVGR